MTTIKLSSRDAIIEAAFLTFNENPGASLGDVADRAGVGRATLHRYFSSRRELMLALARIALQELRSAVDVATADARSHAEALNLLFAAVIPLASRQWFLSNEIVDNDPDIAAAYKRDTDELLKLIEAAKAEGAIASDLPTPWVAATYENLIYAAWTMVRRQEATPNQAADMAWRTFLKGVSK